MKFIKRILYDSKHADLVSKWQKLFIKFRIPVYGEVRPVSGDFLVGGGLCNMDIFFNVQVLDKCRSNKEQRNIYDCKWIKRRDQNMIYVCHSINNHPSNPRDIVIGVFHYANSSILKDILLSECETCGPYIDTFCTICHSHRVKKCISNKGYLSAISIIEQSNIPVLNLDILDITYGKYNIQVEPPCISSEPISSDQKCYIVVIESIYKADLGVSIPICYIDITSSIQSFAWDILDMDSNMSIYNIVCVSTYKDATSIVNNVKSIYSDAKGWMRNVKGCDISLEIPKYKIAFYQLLIDCLKMEDLIPLILEFSTRLPKYRRVSKLWNNATDTNIRMGYGIDTHMNSKYPHWSMFLYLQLDTSNPEFNYIWTLYVNMMSYNRDWESMIHCISRCKGNRDLVGKLLHSLYMNHQYDICNSMYNKLIKFNRYLSHRNNIIDYDIVMLYYMFKTHHTGRFSLLHTVITQMNYCSHNLPFDIEIIDISYRNLYHDSNIFVIENLDVNSLYKPSYNKSLCIRFKYKNPKDILWTREMIQSDHDSLKTTSVGILGFDYPILYYTHKDLWNPIIWDTTYYSIDATTIAINLAKSNYINFNDLV